MIRRSGGAFIGGPLDIWAILYNTDKRTYHAAFFEEIIPKPSQLLMISDMSIVKLRCRYHHTKGSYTMTGGLDQLVQFNSLIKVDRQNVMYHEFIDWDGQQKEIEHLLPSWRKK